ncbi:hypothetical protein QGM71_12785 [Virgibacillus sp. C22-A2]|uniref:DUF1440 domain-containing protein n=1 Tax=Virgibacillus tibetensis TaxID=3042313 RepID=A0ABU6KH18_9BACI|nr:hypothetical protein [Virgibacillus sp. C22-A2]
MKIVFKLVTSGILSGLVLGVFLKVVEEVSEKTVYTLLLNIDYFPIIQYWKLSETVEFTLHIIVSVLFAAVLYFLFKQRNIHKKISAYIVGSIFVGGLLYLTTAFSDRTPVLTDSAAFIYWMVGHLIYGVIVGCLLSIKKKE